MILHGEGGVLPSSDVFGNSCVCFGFPNKLEKYSTSCSGTWLLDVWHVQVHFSQCRVVPLDFHLGEKRA